MMHFKLNIPQILAASMNAKEKGIAILMQFCTPCGYLVPIKGLPIQKALIVLAIAKCRSNKL